MNVNKSFQQSRLRRELFQPDIGVLEKTICFYPEAGNEAKHDSWPHQAYHIERQVLTQQGKTVK